MAVATTKNSYPRAQPFYATEEQPVDPTLRLRRWTYRLAGTVAVLLVILTAGVVFLLNQDRSEAAPAPAISPEANSPKAPAKSASSAIDKEEKTPSAIAVSALKDRYLEALGGLSASHLYQSYLNIGLLADGVEKEVYSLEEAEKMLASVADLMKLVEIQLAKVRQSDLTSDDLASLQRIKAVMGLLRLQSETLQNYWATGENDEAAQYHQAREAAWKGLSKVLGLEEGTN
jgi:hypothetical protein